VFFSEQCSIQVLGIRVVCQYSVTVFVGVVFSPRQSKQYFVGPHFR